MVDTPPPPAPPSVDFESFHTVSAVAPMEVPPTPITFGWLAGSSTDSESALGDPEFG
jgi:hypothetical protein